MANNVTGITDGNGKGASYKDTNGNFATHQLDANGLLQVNTVAGSANQVASANLTSIYTASGGTINAPAAGSVTPALSLAGYKTAGVAITGTFSGTVVPDVSVDGVNWVECNFVSATGSVNTSITSAQQMGIVIPPGFCYVRIRCTAYSSGTIVANLVGSTVDPPLIWPGNSSTGQFVNVQGHAVFGSQGNAWSAASVSSNGNSSSVDCSNAGAPGLCVIGNTNGASTLTVYASADNTNFYSTGLTVAANGDFFLSIANVGARYIRLNSGSAATITASIVGKS